MNRTKTTTNRQNDRILVVTLLSVMALLGVTTMAFDIGHHRHEQNVAEAAALAGAQELPLNPAGAISKATQSAMNHGISPNQIKAVQVRTTSYTNDTLYIEIQEDWQWTLGRVLGKVTHPGGATATALSGGHLMPWALLYGDSDCLDNSGNAILNASCAVKVGAGGIVNGWYGALDYDGKGGGAAEYEANIIDGTTDWKYCIERDPAPGCASAVSVIDTLDGNKVGPTGRGINKRTAVAACDANGNGNDDFGEVFTTNPGGTPAYRVVCPNSPRLIIVPIVTFQSTPVKTVTIRGWALGYLNGYGCVASPASTAAGPAPLDASSGPNPPTQTVTTPSSAHAFISVLASPTPAQVCNGKGHWQVYINIVDAAYCQTCGFLGGYNAAPGIKS